MKKFLLLLLFATAFSHGQKSATRIAFDNFKTELESYQANTENSTLKPAPCKDYALKYIVKGSNFEEIVIPTTGGDPCSDIMNIESKKPATPGESYDIKAIGNRYYSIRIDRNDGKVVQTWYYYERKK
jgi:hypothetical protein